MAKITHAHGKEVHAHVYPELIHASKESQFFGTPHSLEDLPAMKSLMEGLRLESDNIDLLLELAGLYNSQMRFREALELYDRAVALRPGDPALRRQRAPRLLNTLQLERAWEDFHFCEERNSGTLDLAYRLGMTCYFMGRYAEAVDWFAKARNCADREDNAEMAVAALYWQFSAGLDDAGTNKKRLNRQGWLNFDFSRDSGHHWAYAEAAQAFVDPSAGAAGALHDHARVLYGRAAASEELMSNTLNATMLNYGAYQLYRLLGSGEEAAQVLEETLAHDGFWSCYAYLGAWTQG
jgi:tetratricopeptide (TPR) repeat protein